MKAASLSALAIVAAFVTHFVVTSPWSIAKELPPAADKLAELLAIGEPIYVARCKECHGAAGGGFVGPKLVGNDRLANAGPVIRQITGGGADMPAFRNRLTADEILAVGTYVRNSWGNSYGILPR
ncbi:MAG: cytochrome c [Devosia sp.]